VILCREKQYSILKYRKPDFRRIDGFLYESSETPVIFVGHQKTVDYDGSEKIELFIILFQNHEKKRVYKCKKGLYKVGIS
jgi:hypothetical protein